MKLKLKRVEQNSLDIIAEVAELRKDFLKILKGTLYILYTYYKVLTESIEVI